jgi:hypothetical protein
VFHKENEGEKSPAIFCIRTRRKDEEYCISYLPSSILPQSRLQIEIFLAIFSLSLSFVQRLGGSLKGAFKTSNKSFSFKSSTYVLCSSFFHGEQGNEKYDMLRLMGMNLNTYMHIGN